MIMKKFFIVAIAFLFMAFAASAQQRTKIADGVYLVRYGNTAVLEDDINQKTWNMSVTRQKKSAGEYVYDFACGNKYTKAITKYALKSAITAGVAYGTGSPTLAGLSAKIADYFYDDVCDYFGEKR